MKYLFFLFTVCIQILNSSLVIGQSCVTFKVKSIPVADNQSIGIRGNQSPLSWDKSSILKKVRDNYVTEIFFSDSVEDIAFKYVIINDDGQITWESISNRKLQLANDKKTEVNSIWNREQAIDISTLKAIPAKQLLEDYELIKTMILEVHPGTYRYNTGEDIETALAELKSKFSQSLTHQEAYVAISKMTAQLKCDHTKAGFNNQDVTINSIIHYQNDKVPFTFQWVEDEMIVTYNASENKALKRGSKIISMNSIPVLEIRQRMLPLIGADGATDKNRIYKTEVNGYDFRYNAFDIFYPLLYPSKGGKLELQVQQINSNKTEAIQVTRLSREDRLSTLITRYPDFPKSRDDMWNFEILENNIAKLTLNSFGLNGWKAMTIDYKAFLAKAFGKIKDKGIDNLIIDIRENTGGNDEMAKELFKYLAKREFDYLREGRTRFIMFPESLKPHIRKFDENPWYYILSPTDTNTADGYYIFKDNFTPRKDTSEYPIYQGNTYMITSSANTSLAYYTAARFKFQGLGLTVGQETGGNLNDINGGQILFLKLPNSDIEIDVPIIGGFSNTPKPNTGVQPDLEITYRRDDIVQHKDLEVEVILKLIKD